MPLFPTSHGQLPPGPWPCPGATDVEHAAARAITTDKIRAWAVDRKRSGVLRANAMKHTLATHVPSPKGALFVPARGRMWPVVHVSVE